MSFARAGLLCLALIAAGLPTAAQDDPAIAIETFARSMQPGEVVRLDVRCACPTTPPVATAFGADIPLFPVDDRGHWRGLIGMDLDVEPGSYPVRLAWDRAGAPAHTSVRMLEVRAKQFPVRRLRVNSRFVDPPKSAQPRIEREAALLESLFGTVGPRLWDRPFRMPVPHPANSNFGTRSIFNGKPRNPHGGVDFRSPSGTPIVAPAAGRVALAAPLYFSGNTVILDHGQGLYSLFAHLSQLGVSKGEMVVQGGRIGLVGATGRVTGAHLHWTVRLRGARVDPLSLIAAAAE